MTIEDDTRAEQDKIRALLEGAGMTKKEAARLLGMSSSRFRSMLRRPSPPPPPIYAKLLEKLIKL